MTTKFAIQTILEIAVLGAIILGFWKEKALIAFEDKIADKFRKGKKNPTAEKSFVVHKGGKGAHCA